MSKKKYNLFIYGSLRDRRIFQSVCGFNVTRKPSKTDEDTLLAEPAILPYHRKVSPDNVYYYAVASPSSSIEGFVIHGLPASVLAEIDRYEGKRYKREEVAVNTAKGRVKAQAYLVSQATMKKRFGDRFHVNLIHELWLRKRIKKFLEKHTRPGDKTADAEFERLAERELLATTERDLVITHYRADAVSDYYLEHELNRPHPSIKHLCNDPDVVKFMEKYLVLVLKQVLLNQLDERIQSRYRFEIEHIRTSERYFKRSVSLLIALQMMNDNSTAVDMIIQRCLQTMPYYKNDLFDYVKYAVRAAASIFDSRVVESHLERIHAQFRPGLVPLGCELELSNLGAATVEPLASIQKRFDFAYDGFRYFYDFALHILGWKLGAYIDDHSGSADTARRVGFLELAPGRLNIAGELSRPATAAPWLLSQLIQAIAGFYDVQPHSLHLSFQMRKKQIGRQKILPLGFVKCLLALGGGLKEKETGGLWISRMGQDEIKQYSYGEELVFARTSKRKWYIGTDELAVKPPAQTTTQVQQYKFIRLERRTNYEPLIMCLKGLQLGYNPADYLTAEQLKASKKLREEYEELKKWSLDPAPISERTINKFLNFVEQGLMNEGHYCPVHELHYIDWALTAIEVQLQMFNKQIEPQHAAI